MATNRNRLILQNRSRTKKGLGFSSTYVNEECSKSFEGGNNSDPSRTFCLSMGSRELNCFGNETDVKVRTRKRVLETPL